MSLIIDHRCWRCSPPSLTPSLTLWPTSWLWLVPGVLAVDMVEASFECNEGARKRVGYPLQQRPGPSGVSRSLAAL